MKKLSRAARRDVAVYALLALAVIQAARTWGLHEVYVLLLGLLALWAASVAFAMHLRARYWQRIARLHENARIAANEVAGAESHANRQLVRALALLEREKNA